MKENETKKTILAVEIFRNLKKFQQIYTVSILLNHLSNGLINDGNYLNEEEADKNGKPVLYDFDIGLENPMLLATNLLLIGLNMENIVLKPNGQDIEPYIKDKESLNIKNFYKLSFQEKIDFLAEIFYIVSEIEEVKTLRFDFNEVINNLLTYSRENF